MSHPMPPMHSSMACSSRVAEAGQTPCPNPSALSAFASFSDHVLHLPLREVWSSPKPTPIRHVRTDDLPVYNHRTGPPAPQRVCLEKLQTLIRHIKPPRHEAPGSFFMLFHPRLSSLPWHLAQPNASHETETTTATTSARPPGRGQVSRSGDRGSIAIVVRMGHGNGKCLSRCIRSCLSAFPEPSVLAPSLTHTEGSATRAGDSSAPRAHRRIETRSVPP
jgi:hypothetical protein